MSDGRTGYTTGTCAAAAAKAAARAITGEIVSHVAVALPDGGQVLMAVSHVAVLGPGRARAEVIKQAGDDPDVTDGATVCVDVQVLEPNGEENAGCTVEFIAGPGVGIVTRPGLQLPVGEAAINPVPRAMIRGSLEEVLGSVSCRVTVSIPGGEQLAARTFNPRLGIVGGLSILGTSGRVFPRSDKAWILALLPQIDVALSLGERNLYLAPGRFGEEAASALLGAPPAAVIRCSNFVGVFLDACVQRGAERIVLVGHAGKLVKIAAGIFNTHSVCGDARLETLAATAAAAGASFPLVSRLLALPTVEAAVDVLAEAGLDQVWHDVAEKAAQRARARAFAVARDAGRPTPGVECVLVDYRGRLLGQSRGVKISGGQRVERPPGVRKSGESVAVAVVGWGPGDDSLITPAAWREIRQAEVIVGGRRHLEQWAPEAAEKIPITADVEALVDAIRARIGRKVVVVGSGDPSCFGVASTIRRLLPEVDLRITPGISAFQSALARLGLSWEEVEFCSAHGRGLGGVLSALALSPRVLVLTDPANSAQRIARALVERGFKGQGTVLERLGLADERVTKADLETLAASEFDPLAVMLLEPAGTMDAQASLGLTDEAFLRGTSPMTKAEVRAVVLAKARLSPRSRVLDVGAGTGSISVEAGRICLKGQVVAVERESEAIRLLRANIARLTCGNVTLVEGEAPEILKGLGRFDRVIVGGSGGRLKAILGMLPDLLVPGGRVVFPCVCLETIMQVADELRRDTWRDFECVQVNVARGVPVGERLRLSGLNPVWVASAQLETPGLGRTVLAISG